MPIFYIPIFAKETDLNRWPNVKRQTEDTLNNANYKAIVEQQTRQMPPQWLH